MSVEARLQALVQNYRAQFGDAALSQSPQLIAQLSVQAPDLHGEIKALAAAISRGAAARISAAADQNAEATAVATEIATSEKLSMAVASAGVAAARQIGPTSAAPAAPPAMAPAPAAAPAYQPQGGAAGYVPPGSEAPVGQPAASRPIHQNPFVIAGAIALVLGGLIYWQRSTDVVVNGQGTGRPVAQKGGPLPALRSSSPLPTLTVNRNQEGVAVLFQFETPRGAAPGVVILPLNGWDQAPTQVAFGRVGDVPPQVQVVNEGSTPMQRMRGDGGRAARAGRVQWQQDGLGLGPICVAFQGGGQSQSRDVGLSGTTMCVMDANCQRSTACGRLP